MKTGQKKRLLGGIKKTKTTWERWYVAIKEEEKLQSNNVTVQCIDFCEATNTHVFWWQLLITKKIHTNLCVQILHASMFQIFSRCIHTTPSGARHTESEDSVSS